MAKGENFKSTIHAKDVEISIVTSINNEDYISLTDIAKYKNPEFPADVITKILNWSNSTSLKLSRVQIHLFYHLKNGLKRLTL